MNKGISLPTDYVPYDELHLCSNTLINVQIPFLIGEVPLLLIGKNTTPQIWLSAKTSPGSNEWKYIVEKNKSLNPAVYVDTQEKNQTVYVKVGTVVIMKATTETTIKATIEVLDLRPIGLNVYGDSSGLSVATNKFSGNSMMNSHVAFSLGV